MIQHNYAKAIQETTKPALPSLHCLAHRRGIHRTPDSDEAHRLPSHFVCPAAIRYCDIGPRGFRQDDYKVPETSNVLREEVEHEVNTMPDPRDEERKPLPNPWLERIEMRCAQAWALALLAAEESEFQKDFADEQDWKRAWIQVHALRLGRSVQFFYPQVAWRTVAPGVAVKP